jgi:hypothetical protein
VSTIALASWLLLADASSNSKPPEDVAAAWLHALSDADVPELRRLTVLPFAADGFQNNTRASENVCNSVRGMRRNPKTREIFVSAKNDMEFAPVLTCLLSDNTNLEWTKADIRPSVRLLGSPRESSHRLVRYRPRLRSMAKSDVLVEAEKTLDGVTMTAFLVLRPSAGSFAVSAYYLDFLFEE